MKGELENVRDPEVRGRIERLLMRYSRPIFVAEKSLTLARCPVGIAWSPSFRMMAVQEQRDIKIYETKDWSLTATISPDRILHTSAFSPDGSALAVRRQDVIEMYSTASHESVGEIPAGGSFPGEMFFLDADHLLFARMEEFTVKCYVAARKGGSWQLGAIPIAGSRATGDPAGSMVATIDIQPPSPHSWTVWSTSSWKPLAKMEINYGEGESDGLYLLQFSPDSRLLSLRGPQGFMDIVSTQTWKPIARWSDVADFSFFNDSQHVIVEDAQGGLHLRRCDTGRIVSSAPEGGTLLGSAPDSPRVAVWSRRKELLIYSVITEDEARR